LQQIVLHVFEHYGGGTLPEKEFVSSVLFKKFSLDGSLHEEFCDLYQQSSATRCTSRPTRCWMIATTITYRDSRPTSASPVG
jgi:hypothetical protein